MKCIHCAHDGELYEGEWYCDFHTRQLKKRQLADRINELHRIKEAVDYLLSGQSQIEFTDSEKEVMSIILVDTDEQLEEIKKDSLIITPTK